MYIRIPAPQPIFQSKITEFEAADPWNGNQRAAWLLGLYKLGPMVRSPQPGSTASNEIPAGHALGLFCRTSNQLHLMPYSLYRHWRQGSVQPQHVAPLLRRAEELRRVDQEVIDMEDQMRLLALVFTIVGAPLAVAAAVLLWMGRLDASIMSAFFGSIMLGMGLFGWVRYTLWKRRHKRFYDQWPRLLEELQGQR